MVLEARKFKNRVLATAKLLIRGFLLLDPNMVKCITW
jgi:hypothetical protein